MAGTKVSVKAAGIAGGVMLAVYMFLATLVAMNNINIYGFSNEYFNLLVTIFPGLSASVIGLFIGAAWGFVHGFILAAVFAWLYDWAMSKWG